MRVLIAGGPRCGKTTFSRVLAPRYGVSPISTDSLIGQKEWSEASAEVARWLDEPGPWVIEGVSAVRALRKWLASHPEGKPCDQVVWMGRPVVPLSRGQAAMFKACRTVWREIRGEIVKRGVDVRYEEGGMT